MRLDAADLALLEVSLSTTECSSEVARRLFEKLVSTQAALSHAKERARQARDLANDIKPSSGPVYDDLINLVQCLDDIVGLE